MKHKVKKILLIFFILIMTMFSLVTLAHPGSLDSNGGHYNRKTGEYHYHEGLHTTGRNSSSGNYENFSTSTLYDNDYIFLIGLVVVLAILSIICEGWKGPFYLLSIPFGMIFMYVMIFISMIQGLIKWIINLIKKR